MPVKINKIPDFSIDRLHEYHYMVHIYEIESPINNFIANSSYIRYDTGFIGNFVATVEGKFIKYYRDTNTYTIKVSTPDSYFSHNTTPYFEYRCFHHKDDFIKIGNYVYVLEIYGNPDKRPIVDTIQLTANSMKGLNDSIAKAEEYRKLWEDDNTQTWLWAMVVNRLKEELNGKNYT